MKAKDTMYVADVDKAMDTTYMADFMKAMDTIYMRDSQTRDEEVEIKCWS